MPNNLDPEPISINFLLTNNPPTIDASTFANLLGEFFRVLELEFLMKSSKKHIQLTTFFQQKNETFKMFYRKFLKLKEDIQSITYLEFGHWYLYLLESTPILHVQIGQQIFVEFGNAYTLLNVYNIYENLELAHAHYEANTMRPPSCSRP
jgi:hypothetical protein